MKLKIVAPLQPNDYYVLDGGFSTQLSRFEAHREEESSVSTFFLFSDMSREWTLTPCGPRGASWIMRRR